MSEEEKHASPIFSPTTPEQPKPPDNEKVMETISKLQELIMAYKSLLNATATNVEPVDAKVEEVNTNLASHSQYAIRELSTLKKDQTRHDAQLSAVTTDVSPVRVETSNIKVELRDLKTEVSECHSKSQERSDALDLHIEKNTEAVGDSLKTLAVNSFNAQGFENAVTKGITLALNNAVAQGIRGGNPTPTAAITQPGHSKPGQPPTSFSSACHFYNNHPHVLYMPQVFSSGNGNIGWTRLDST